LVVVGVWFPARARPVIIQSKDETQSAVWRSTRPASTDSRRSSSRHCRNRPSTAWNLPAAAAYAGWAVAGPGCRDRSSSSTLCRFLRTPQPLDLGTAG